MPARWNLSEEMEATAYPRPATPTDWLHPEAESNARAGTTSLPGIALAARHLWGRGRYHLHSSLSKRSSVTSLEMVPLLLPSFPISCCPVCQANLGQRWRGRTSRGWQRDGQLMAGKGQETGRSPKGWQVTLEIGPEGGSLCVHPNPASLGMLRRQGGERQWGEAAHCGFTVHLCPLNPHVNVEVVKCHQLGRGEGARACKTPTKGGHCLGRAGGGPAGEPAECLSVPSSLHHPTAQVTDEKAALFPH